MSDPVEIVLPAAGRSRSAAAREASRRKKAAREERIIRLLAGGVSISGIAAREGVTRRRVRMFVQEILDRRAPKPPEDFLAPQVSRLNEALFVSFSAMSGNNLRAVDQVVKIVRELDRHHGFAGRPSVSASPNPSRRSPSSADRRSARKRRRKPLKVLDSRKEMAPPSTPLGSRSAIIGRPGKGAATP